MKEFIVCSPRRRVIYLQCCYTRFFYHSTNPHLRFLREVRYIKHTIVYLSGGGTAAHLFSTLAFRLSVRFSKNTLRLSLS